MIFPTQWKPIFDQRGVRVPRYALEDYNQRYDKDLRWTDFQKDLPAGVHYQPMYTGKGQRIPRYMLRGLGQQKTTAKKVVLVGLGLLGLYLLFR